MRTLMILAFFVGVAGHSATETVRFQLANGDVLSAAVLSETDTSWKVVHPNLGELELNKSAATRLAEVKAPVATVAKKAPKAVKKSNPHALKKSISLGLNGHVSKRHSQDWHTGLALSKKSAKRNWNADFDWFYGATDGQKTENEGQLVVNHDWYLGAKKERFVFARTEQEYDELASWEMRNSLFGGVGYKMTSPEKGSVLFRGGAGGSYEHGSVKDWKPEAIFASGSSQWKLTDYQSLKGELAYYPNLEDFSEYRTNLKLEWRTKVPDVKGLSLKIGIRDVFNSMASNTKSNNDFKYFAGIVYDL